MESNNFEKNEQAINDLVFNELVKRGFEDKEGKRVWNIADSKLWYLSPEQSQGYLEITHTPKYKENIITKELALLEQVFPKLLIDISGRFFNLLDLGCGDGEKAALFIKTLSEFVNVRYCPIDISSYMVKKAAETVRNSGLPGNVVEMKWNVSDFENLSNVSPLFREGKFENHLFMLLGNTLGNFDINIILNGIKQGMKHGDILIIGNGITESNTDVSTLISAYNDNSIDNWLSQVPKGLGFKSNEIKFGTRFANSRMEEYYTVLVTKKVYALGREICFKAGDEILVAFSNKYTPEFLREKMKLLLIMSAHTLS